MKDHYSIFKRKAGAVLICALLFAGIIANGQTKSLIEQAEEDAFSITNRILSDVEKQTNMSQVEYTQFTSYYQDTIVKYHSRLFRKLRKNGPVSELKRDQYIGRLEDYYTKLYNNFKEISTEFPSSIAEVLHKRTNHGFASGVCNPACDNIDFEKADLSGWTACWADCSAEGLGTPTAFSYTTPTCTGPITAGTTQSANDANTSSFQVSLTSAGADPVVGAALQMVAPGGGAHSCMIGDGTGIGYGVALLEQTFQVTAANADFYYMYAVVLQNPAQHSYFQQPYFNVALLDQNGDTIPKCGNYSVVAGSGTSGAGWNKITYQGDATYWLPWQNAFVSLKKYLGTCVTVVIRTSDCGQGGHFGYAYFDSKCQQLGIITSAPSICGSPITLTAPSGGVSYKWTGPCVIGSATAQTITVGCAGKYTVIIQDVVGAACADTLDTVIVSSTGTGPKPFFKPDTVCAGNPTTFTNATTGGTAGTQYKWTFVSPITSTSDTITTGAGTNPSFTYPAAGNYTATLSATTNGCGGDTILPVIVVGPPTAAFTASTVCLNTPTVFTNTSTPTTGPFSWKFGDGGTSTLQNPTHTYAACGTYKVVLTVGIKGCLAKDSINVTVNPNPVPSFVADTVCISGATQFTDKTTIACGGSITGWSWKFGDPGNGTSAVQNPTYTYPATGNYNVTLTSTSNNGCQTAVTLPIEVVGKPVVAFTVTNVCVGQSTTFNNTSTGATTWKWNFGDGPPAGTSTVKNPTYTYATAGTYTVKLVASTGAGCVDSTTNTITVNPSPVGAATASTVCQGTGTVFTNTTTGASTYKWSFGDTPPGTSTVAGPTYTYPAAGSYTATLISTSANGCTDTIKVPVVVNPSPTGTFTVPPVCLGTASVFTLTTTNMAGGTYAWTFGDGGTSAAQNPTYTYATAGAFNVSVTLTSAGACTGTATGTAIVSSIPVANFVAPAVCQDQAMKFTDQSTVTGGKDTAWLWNFGDGHTSTVQNPTHQYAACGTYNVMLTVTSNAKCVHDTTIPVTINAVPLPSFIATSVCQGLVTNFTDKSTIGCAATNTIAGWSWNFGDGTAPNTTQNPTHTYGAAGIYQVSLTVTSSTGCDSTVKLPVTVYPIPVPAFTQNAPCFGTATNFTDQSSVAGGTIQGWAWSFGDPANSTSGTQNPSFTYPAAGNYNVTLIVTSNHGCIDSITKPVIVYPIPVPEFFSDTLGCTPLCVSPTEASSTVAPPSFINSWLWNFGDGSIDSVSVSQNPKHCYNTPGTYTMSLTVGTTNGCSATLVKPNYITAWPVPVAKFNASPNPTVLVNNPTVVFTDQSTGSPVSWSWFNFGDGKDSMEITENTTHTYTDTGTFVVYLAIKNKFGCVDTTEVPVIVQPIWTFYVPNAFTPNGDGINDGFIAKGIGILSYEMWIFDRWGMQLYHCTDMQHPWNGTVQGTSGLECQEDTYVWLIQFVDVFHGSHRYVGKVTIIK